MPEAAIYRNVMAVRRDVGSLCFHWTRARGHGADPAGTQRGPASARQVLTEILDEAALRGSWGFIRGSYRCICFSEAPVSEAAALFRLSELAPREQRPRYEPYGIAVRKDWLFAQGGRPVIYQPDAEYDVLPESIRWRHCRFDLGQRVDFSWEREWRIKADTLRLDPRATLILVPTTDEAYELMYTRSEVVPTGYDEDGNPEGPYHEPRWLAVSLEVLGVPVPVNAGEP